MSELSTYVHWYEGDSKFYGPVETFEERRQFGARLSTFRPKGLSHGRPVEGINHTPAMGESLLPLGVENPQAKDTADPGPMFLRALQHHADEAGHLLPIGLNGRTETPKRETGGDDEALLPIGMN